MNWFIVLGVMCLLFRVGSAECGGPRLASWLTTSERLNIVAEGALKLLSKSAAKWFVVGFKEHFKANLGAKDQAPTSCQVLARVSSFQKELQANQDLHGNGLAFDRFVNDLRDHGSSMDTNNATGTRRCGLVKNRMVKLVQDFNSIIRSSSLKSDMAQFMQISAARVEKYVDTVVVVSVRLQLDLIAFEDFCGHSDLYDVRGHIGHLSVVLAKQMDLAKEHLVQEKLSSVLANILPPKKADTQVLVDAVASLKKMFPYWSWDVKRFYGDDESFAVARHPACGAFKHGKYLVSYYDNGYELNNNDDASRNFNQRSKLIANKLVNSTFGHMNMNISLDLANNSLSYNCLETNYGYRCEKFFQQFQSRFAKENRHLCFYMVENFFPTLCPPNFYTTRNSITYGVESYWCGLTVSTTPKAKAMRSDAQMPLDPPIVPKYASVSTSKPSWDFSTFSRQIFSHFVFSRCSKTLGKRVLGRLFRANL